ncbi:MAG: hypothetical protein U9P72_06930 [Campylobacterota bacterium]|nr:hypothetical protein [Campylobacterota bacterium]
MKKYILFILIISSITILHAKESIEIRVFCSDSKKEEFNIRINSNKLNLSEDALQDNTGGYVDIAEDSYYLKTDNNLYYLSGVVKYSNENNINQFNSKIDKNSKKAINLKELYSLRDSKNLKFIQKIYLEKNNKTNTLKKNVTTNILDVSFNEKSFTIENRKSHDKVENHQKIHILKFYY